MPYIYRIINKVNGKTYIGKTEHSDPQKRWKEHLREARRTRSQSRSLYRAIRKYGEDNFTFEVIEETDDPCERERFHILNNDSFKSGYNETIGEDGTSYVELDEEKVCRFYSDRKSIRATAERFGHDRATIIKILNRNNINVISSGKIFRDKVKRRVARVDLNSGEILSVYDCIADANREYSAGNHIPAVCNGKRKSCCGFGWKYVS